MPPSKKARADALVPTSAGRHQRLPVDPRARMRGWPGTLMAFSILAALASALTVVPWTLVRPALLLRAFLGLCFAGALLPYARSGLRLGMELLEWLLFNVLAIGPLATMALLWANYAFHGPVATSVHAVREVHVHGAYLTYVFADGYLDAHWMARSTYIDWPGAHGRIMAVSTARGLLGVPVVVRKEPVRGVTPGG